MGISANELIEILIETHGGRERWRSLETIEFRLSSSGLAFALHGQASALLGKRVKLWPHARRVELHDYRQPGWRGVWTPARVWVLDATGREVVRRDDPRASFSRWSRQVRWDGLDMLYFAGYALWNYMTFPFLLEEMGVAMRGVDSGRDGVRRIDISFSPDFPTHSSSQSFHIDASGNLLRHDYTADVIGRWATAANFCLDSVQVDGLRFYTRRRVYPRFGTGVVLPAPTLVWIEIDDLTVGAHTL